MSRIHEDIIQGKSNLNIVSGKFLLNETWQFYCYVFISGTEILIQKV